MTPDQGASQVSPNDSDSGPSVSTINTFESVSNISICNPPEMEKESLVVEDSDEVEMLSASDTESNYSIADVPFLSSSSSASSFSDLEDASTDSSVYSDFPAFPHTISNIPSYKLVGDNVDKEVKPREMRSDHQTRSLHYFHAYAVRDRIDLSSVSDVKVTPDIGSINITDLLPSASDDEELKKNFTLLMCQTLKKYMPFFGKFATGISRHIKHEYFAEMSQKSEVVSVV